LEAPQVETLQEEIDLLREEVTRLRASRQRLALAVDADRHLIERALHNGVQQRLVALAVGVQLAGQVADSQTAERKALLEDLQRDVQHALDETAALAESISPPLLEAGGLAVALRAAAVRADVRVSVDVASGSALPPHVARTVYWCWVEVLQHGGRPALTVREEGADLVFVVDRAGVAPALESRLDWLRDRVEALGGRLIIESGADATCVRGALPLA
jgi:signal transduction histidine kinase